MSGNGQLPIPALNGWRSRLLSAAEEIELARRTERGDDRARQALVEANIALAVAVAKQYHAPGLSFSDLVQDGCVGLVEAAARYDHRRGCRFSTYSTWYIAGAVKRGLRRTRFIRPPESATAAERQVRDAETRLTQELRRKPSMDEVARLTGMTVAEVDEIVTRAQAPASLQAPIHGTDKVEGGWLADDPSWELERVLLRETVLRALDALNERDRAIVKLRFGLDGEPHSLEQVGRIVGLSSERVRQIEHATLDQLRVLLSS